MIKGPLIFGLIVFVMIATISLTRYISKITSISIPKEQEEASSTGPTVTINNQSFKVDIADSLITRNKGLSGRDKLDDDRGMYFIFDMSMKYGFWMKGMKFPIDIIWIYDDKIIGFSENAEPEPGKSIFGLKVYYPPSKVNRALEVNAGTVSKYGIKAGDGVIFAR